MSQSPNDADQLFFAFLPRIFPLPWRRHLYLLMAALLIGTGLAWTRTYSSSHDDVERFQNRVTTCLQVVDTNTIDIEVPEDRARFARVCLLGIRSSQSSGGKAPARLTDRTMQPEKSLVENQTVRIVLSPQQTRDREGRLLAYIYLTHGHDDLMLNEEIIARGWGEADYRVEHPWRFRFQQLEERARKRQQDVWSLPDRERQEPGNSVVSPQTN